MKHECGYTTCEKLRASGKPSPAVMGYWEGRSAAKHYRCLRCAELSIYGANSLTHGLTVNGYIWRFLSDPAQPAPKAESICSCPIQTLMLKGCSCGYMKTMRNRVSSC